MNFLLQPPFSFPTRLLNKVQILSTWPINSLLSCRCPFHPLPLTLCDSALPTFFKFLELVTSSATSRPSLCFYCCLKTLLRPFCFAFLTHPSGHRFQVTSSRKLSLATRSESGSLLHLCTLISENITHWVAMGSL